jgi:hypothetical protein
MESSACMHTRATSRAMTWTGAWAACAIAIAASGTRPAPGLGPGRSPQAPARSTPRDSRRAPTRFRGSVLVSAPARVSLLLQCLLFYRYNAWLLAFVSCTITSSGLMLCCVAFTGRLLWLCFSLILASSVVLPKIMNDAS